MGRPRIARGLGRVNDYDDQVRAYLAYCRKAAAELRLRGSVLDPKWHPTADGAVKMIPHRGVPAKAKQIREMFKRLSAEAVTGTGTAA